LSQPGPYFPEKPLTFHEHGLSYLREDISFPRNSGEVFMRTIFLLLLIVAMLRPAVALATDVEGDVWGTWIREKPS
jgi:hypothetical protein